MRFLFFTFSLFKRSFFFQPFYLFGGRVLKQRTFDKKKSSLFQVLVLLTKRCCVLVLADPPSTIVNRLFESETSDTIITLLGLLADCHETIAPAVQGPSYRSESGGQKLVFHDGVSGGCVTQTEYLIAKFASEAKLNKRTGDKLIALTSRADFDPGEMRTNSIRQIERWIADANDPNAIQEFDLLRASDENQESTLYLRNHTVNVENLVFDVRYNGYQYLSFELLERNGERVFGPANSGYDGK